MPDRPPPARCPPGPEGRSSSHCLRRPRWRPSPPHAGAGLGRTAESDRPGPGDEQEAGPHTERALESRLYVGADSTAAGSPTPTSSSSTPARTSSPPAPATPAQSAATELRPARPRGGSGRATASPAWSWSRLAAPHPGHDRGRARGPRRRPPPPPHGYHRHPDPRRSRLTPETGPDSRKPTNQPGGERDDASRWARTKATPSGPEERHHPDPDDHADDGRALPGPLRVSTPSANAPRSPP